VAHTIAIGLDRHRVFAFLPLTHRAPVFADDGWKRRISQLLAQNGTVSESATFW